MIKIPNLVYAVTLLNGDRITADPENDVRWKTETIEEDSFYFGKKLVESELYRYTTSKYNALIKTLTGDIIVLSMKTKSYPTRFENRIAEDFRTEYVTNSLDYTLIPKHALASLEIPIDFIKLRNDLEERSCMDGIYFGFVLSSMIEVSFDGSAWEGIAMLDDYKFNYTMEEWDKIFETDALENDINVIDDKKLDNISWVT